MTPDLSAQSASIYMGILANVINGFNHTDMTAEEYATYAEEVAERLTKGFVEKFVETTNASAHRAAQGGEGSGPRLVTE